MPQIRAHLLALCLLVLLLPSAIYLKKFTDIAIPVRHKVSFDPIACYACKDCPCVFLLDDGLEYRVNKYDKNRCTLDAEEINEGIQNNLSSIEVKVPTHQYVNFSNCIDWYARHPTASR